MSSSKTLRIGLIVGETSGAIIALGMIKEIKAIYPDCIIEGIGSQELVDEGMHSLFDMNELSVMGLVEVLKHLPRLLYIRKTVVNHFIANPPDVFIGVDSPDFNLRVETTLKKAGIPTVHYVSPTVWAWREKRIHKIAKATNLVLGVFPFEQDIYDKYDIPFKFVGHTMADAIPLEVNKPLALSTLIKDAKAHNTQASPTGTLASASSILALLPGSRSREITSLLPVFLDCFAKLKKEEPNLCAVIPAVNDGCESQILTILNEHNLQGDVVVTRCKARDVMIAADAVLLASGTAALEAMLCKRPMVVAYTMSSLTYFMMKRLYKPDFFALPNILAGKLLVPEFLQEDVNPDNLLKHLKQAKDIKNDAQKQQQQAFVDIHKTLACGADKTSAMAVLALINRLPVEAK